VRWSYSVLHRCRFLRHSVDSGKLYVTLTTTRCCASAVYATALFLCVCDKSVFYRYCRMDRASIWHNKFVVILQCAIRKFYSGRFHNYFWNSVQRSGLKNLFKDVDRCKCCQLALIDVQFITQSISLCVQHHWRDAARRAGLSTAYEACLFYRATLC